MDLGLKRSYVYQTPQRISHGHEPLKTVRIQGLKSRFNYSVIAYLLRVVVRTQKVPCRALFVFHLIKWVLFVSMRLSSLNRKSVALCVRRRFGKTIFSTKIIYFITNILGRFEEYKNTQDFKKRGHYIPKLLLRRFRLSEDGPDKGMIYQYSFLKDSITKEPINQVAQIEDFYIFRQKTGGNSDYVEKEIYANWIESFGSQVIKTINQTNGNPKLTIFEQNILATFISHQITRTPTFYVQLRKYILFLYEKGLLKIEDLGSSSFIKEVIVKNKYSVTYDEIVNYVPNHSVAGDTNHLGHISRLIAGEMMEDIFRHNFHFLHIPNDSSDEFVISDNPVVFIDFERYETKRYVDWWEKRSDKVWIFIPLSPKKCLYLTTKRRIDGPVVIDNEDMTKIINFGQYLNALSFVYGRDKSLIEQHMKKFLPELLKYKTIVADPAQILKK